MTVHSHLHTCTRTVSSWWRVILPPTRTCSPMLSMRTWTNGSHSKAREDTTTQARPTKTSYRLHQDSTVIVLKLRSYPLIFTARATFSNLMFTRQVLRRGQQQLQCRIPSLSARTIPSQVTCLLNKKRSFHSSGVSFVWRWNLSHDACQPTNVGRVKLTILMQ